MMFCPNCGTRNDDDASFCAECGALLNAQQGGGADAQNGMPDLSSGDAAPVTDATGVVGGGAAPDVWMSGNMQTAAGKPEKGKKALIGVAVAAVVAAAAVAAVMLVRKPKEESTDNHLAQQVLYIEDDSLYFTKLSKIDPVEVKEDVVSSSKNFDSYSLNAQYSEDGRSLFFIDFESKLYRYDIKSDECEKLDSDVSRYSLLADGNVMYEKDDTLYIHDGKDKEKFQKGVNDWELSEDKTRVLWEDGDGRTYVSDAEVDAEKTKIDTDIDEFCYESDNFDCLLYTKDHALYVMSGLDEKEKLTSYVSEYAKYLDYDAYHEGKISETEYAFGYYTPSVFGVGEGKNLKIVYSEESNPETAYNHDEDDGIGSYASDEEIGDFTYWDFVDDDMAASDAAITEPNESDYQSEEEYQLFYGTETYMETDYDAYYAALDEYDEKCMRDSLREELKSRYYHGVSGESLKTVKIYDVAAEETAVVCEDTVGGIYEVQYVDGNAVVEGEYGEYGDYPKIKLSQIWSMVEDYDNMGDAYDNLNSMFKNSLGDRPYEGSFYIYCNGSVYYPFGEDAGDIRILDITEDEDNGNLYVLFTESDDDESSLVQLFTSGSKAGTYTVLYEGVHEILEAQDGSVYYSKDYDSDSNTYDLYCDGEKIDEDVYSIIQIRDGKAYYSKDYDSDDKIYDLYCDGEKVSYDVYISRTADDGTLMFLTDPTDHYHYQELTLSVAGKDSNTKISEDVYNYYYAGDGKFILLKDMNEYHEGDLYYYDGKEMNRISTDVQCFIVPVNESPKGLIYG